MARKGGKGRGGRGGNESFDSTGASPARGRRGRGGRGARGHMGFSTGAFGVLGDDSLNNSDAGAQEVDQDEKGQVQQIREERVDVHMEGGGDAEFRSDMSRVHIQGTSGSPMHITVGSREHLGQRCKEHHISMVEGDQGALRSMHCDDRMMHHRLSRMSINSNADEFIFVGGRPPELRPSPSHEAARGSHQQLQTPDIRVNGEPILAAGGGSRMRSYSVSHHGEELSGIIPTARSRSQFNITGAPSIHIHRETKGGPGITSFAAEGREIEVAASGDVVIPSARGSSSHIQIGDGVGHRRSRSVSRASTHSPTSQGEVHIQSHPIFGGPVDYAAGDRQSRPVSRASNRSVAVDHPQQNNGDFDDKGYRSRSVSRVSLRSGNSNFGGEIVLEDDLDELAENDFQRSSDSSLSTDLNVSRQPTLQLGIEASFDYGTVFDVNNRDGAAPASEQRRRSTQGSLREDSSSIGLNTAFQALDVRPGSRAASANVNDSVFTQRGSSVSSRSVSRVSMNLEDEDEMEHRFDASTRDKSNSRIDLRPEADDLYDQEDVPLEPFMAKGLPHQRSSRTSSHASVHSLNAQSSISGSNRYLRADGVDSREENLYEEDGRRSRMSAYREDAPVLPSPVPSKQTHSDELSDGERQGAYVAGVYHDVDDVPAVRPSLLSHSNVAVEGRDYELTTHFEQRPRTSRSDLSGASGVATRSSSHNSQQPASYRSSGITSTTEMSTYSISETQLGSDAIYGSDLHVRSQSSVRSYAKDESVFGSDVGIDRLKEPASVKSQSTVGPGDADVAYHSVSRSRAASQHSIHSIKSVEKPGSMLSGSHESHKHEAEHNRPSSRISLISNQPQSNDPTRISMNADKSDVVAFESKSGLWYHWPKSTDQWASKSPTPASDKFRHHSISAKPPTAVTKPQAPPAERQSRPLSRTGAAANVSSAHVFPILKLPQRARSLSTHSEKANVGFTEMPELYSHPDEKFGAASPAGVKFRPTAEHQKTPPFRSRSGSMSRTSGSEELIPPRPAPRTSITSIPEVANKDKVVSVAQPIKSSALPTPLHFLDALTPRVERQSVVDHNEPPFAHSITEIKISRTSTLQKDTVTQSSAASPAPSFSTPVRPTGSAFVPAKPSSPISSLIKPTFNNSFETRGHPAATALNVMFSNRVATKESLSSNISEQQLEPFQQQKPNRWTKMPSKWNTPEKTDYNSNQVPVNRNISSAYQPEKPPTSDELQRLALAESRLPSTPKTSRGPIFRREDRLSTKSKAEVTHTTEVAWKVNNSYPEQNERRHEPLRKLPNPTWIVQKSPVKPKEPEDQWKPAAGDYVRQQPTLRIVVQSKEPTNWKPNECVEKSADPREKQAHSTWNAPLTPSPVKRPNEPKKPIVHASWSKVSSKKPGDTVRQNVRPGQIRNLASMFDNIQAKATEEDLILRGNSLRSSICSRRTRRNSEPNESIREDPEEDIISKSKDDSFIDPRHSVRGRYRRNENYAVGSGDGNEFLSNGRDSYWQYENAGLQHALSDYDETDDAFRSRVTVHRNSNIRMDQVVEEPYYHPASMQSEDPDYDDSLPNPTGSVKALAASFEAPNISSPSQQRRNISQISKVSENIRTAREISHHDGNSTGRLSNHASSYYSNRFDNHSEEPSYAQVNKNQRVDDRYAEIRKPRRTSVKEDDYSVIPDSALLHRRNESRSIISMKNDGYYGRFEEERMQKEGDYGSHARGRRVSSRYDEDKSVGGHIDNLFGFVDEHMGSDKLMSSREFLDSDHEHHMRPSKPLTYSMSGYRAIQRSNRRNTSSVTREDIIAAHQKLPPSQQGTVNSHAPARFSPTTAPHIAELSQAGRNAYGKVNNSGASGKRYVVGSALATSTPQQSPRGTVALNYSNHQHSRMEDTSFVSSITDTSRIEIDYRHQITKLQHLVKTNSNQIVLTQKALSQARKESKPIQEMNALKMILILKERVNLLNREIKRLTALSTVRRPPPPQSRDVKGSLTISDVAIHLNRSFYTRTYELNCSYTFLALFKCGTEVEAMAPVTLLANHQNRLRAVHFSEKVNFSNLPVDFCVLLEVYVLALSESKNEDQRGCATVFANKCRNLLPRDRKPTTSPSGFPIGEFQRCGYIQLTRETTSSTKFYLDETEYPLDGTIDITSHCTTLPPSIEVDYRGFLTMYQNVGGMGSWERYWAVLRRGTIFFWNYPDDESMCKQPKARLDLSTCTQEHVVPCTPELCPRPNTFSVNVLVSTAPSVMDKKRLFLSADSAEMLTAWLEAVNDTLSILRA